jgi:hypothetical protein
VSDWYKLDPVTKESVPIDIRDAEEVMKSRESRQVGRDTHDGYTLSTVFLALDHNMSGVPNTRPVLFESMVFDTKGEEKFCERCCTWAEAEAQHAKILAALKAGTLEMY